MSSVILRRPPGTGIARSLVRRETAEPLVGTHGGLAGQPRPHHVTWLACSIATSMSILGSSARAGVAMRPLPELTPANEWFWTSGADGTLRIQECSDCGELVHPPVPICPYCRSRSSKPSPVSGRGTIVGFTVNAHRWHPDFEPPYVIANVALAEDPRVHLTTNIVGCEPAEVEIGQEVAVRVPPTRGRVAAAVRADGSGGPRRPGGRTGAAAPPRPLGRRALRAPGRAQRHRSLHLRPAPHGRPPRAGRGRQPRRHRRRRAHDRRHRRAVDVSRV